MTYSDPQKPDPYKADPYSPDSYNPDSYPAGATGGDPYAQNPYPSSQGAAQPNYGYQQPQQFAPPQPPSANGGWAVATIIFFWPLAFIAVSRAFSVYPLWAQGRYAEAEAASASVKKLGVISLVIIAAVIVLYILAVIIIVAAGVSSDTSV